MLSLLSALALSGCSTMRETAPDRSAREQLLISTAADRAAERLNLKIPAGTYKVTLSREGSNPVTETITVPEGTPRTWAPPPPSPAGTGGAS